MVTTSTQLVTPQVISSGQTKSHPRVDVLSLLTNHQTIKTLSLFAVDTPLKKTKDTNQKKSNFMRTRLFTIILFAIMLVFILMILTGINGKSKYTIKSNGTTYYTNEVVTNGNCIKFVTSTTKETMTLCGAYSIKENKNYKPEKK